ncbi:tRNA 4-thiouridine(8) synthase ThiI, partial [Thermococci archaeon]
MYNSVLVRYSEIGTKSRQTRKKWENILIHNIKEYLKVDFGNIFCSRGRIVILTEKECDLKNIFGVVSFSPAVMIEQDMERIKEKAGEIYSGKKFRVSAKRITKEFPYSS